MTEAEREALTHTGPRRVQLRRTAGWRMPENTIVVTRGKGRLYGNPFTLKAYYAAGYRESEFVAAQHCVAAHRAWLEGKPHWAHGSTLPKVPDLAPLRGKNLACWCGLSMPCHADNLLELANR